MSHQKSSHSYMRKMRLLPESDYQDWRAHRCNENQVEKVMDNIVKLKLHCIAEILKETGVIMTHAFIISLWVR